MSTQGENYFAQLIAAASIQSNARYFEKGDYHVTIDAAKIFLNRMRRPRAAVDVTVISSTNPNFRKGNSISWVVSLDSDSGPATIKTFIYELFGCTKAEAGDAGKISAIFPNESDNGDCSASLAVGLEALVHCYEKQTKAGGVYTRANWKRHDPQNADAPNYEHDMSLLAPEPEADAEGGQHEQQKSGEEIPF